MEGKTHIAGGIAAGVFYLTYREPVDSELLLMGSCILGSLIPDIDHTGSTISRKVPVLDNIISGVFGHRTITHSLLFMMLALWLFKWASWPPDFETGILMGIASHLLLDALTEQGIQFFWPFKIKVGIPFGIATGGMLEEGFMALLVVFIGHWGYTTYF